MAITMITNNSGAQLELWDVGNLLANLVIGAGVGAVPITITSVTRAAVGYHNKTGAFVNNDSYSATFIPAGGGNPAMVRFTGAHSTVNFS